MSHPRIPRRPDTLARQAVSRWWVGLRVLLRQLALTLLLALPPSVMAQGASAATYTVAVVPQYQAIDISRVWSPILERLGQRLGVQLQLRLHKDIPAFEADVLAGGPDLAFMNPYHQVLAHRAQAYRPLVRDTQLLTGILVVRRDDPIQNAKQLEGKAIAYPAPNAFGASILIRAHLQDSEHVSTTPVYAKTHTNAYRQTISGLTAASGGLRATLEKEPAEVRAALRVLFETRGAPPHPLSAHPRVPASLQSALMSAWLALADAPDLQDRFKEIPMPHPVRADYARDYQALESLMPH